MRSNAATRWKRLGTLGLAFVITAGADSPAQEAQEADPAAMQAEQAKKAAIALEEEVTRSLDAVDLTPKPDFDVPDPPPHEGALIDLPPYRIGAPDLLLVEVLEALPGRDVAGERLVRPDGTISLGFYGDIHVQGLTIEQARVKIVKRLRGFLTDQILGLTVPKLGDAQVPGPAPDADKRTDGSQHEIKPQSNTEPEPTTNQSGRIRKAAGRSIRAATRRTIAQRSEDAVRIDFVSGMGTGTRSQDPALPASSEDQTPMEITTTGGVTIHIQIEDKNKAVAPERSPAPGFDVNPFMLPEEPFGLESQASPLLGSDRVFIDVTAYNSNYYFVLGDVGAPGRLPVTGRETVLDALQFAGGPLASSSAVHVRLVRPERNGKPARTYPVDLAGIIDRGETKTNYQIFPGDRLVVARKQVGSTADKSPEGRPTSSKVIDDDGPGRASAPVGPSWIWSLTREGAGPWSPGRTAGRGGRGRSSRTS